MKKLIGKVDEMRKQRISLENQLRESIHSDDITNKIVIKVESDLMELFREELKKHDKVTQVLDQNLLAQDNIIRALTEANANYAETRKKTVQVLKRRDKVIDELITSYENYDELLNKCNKGIEFYTKLDSNVQKLLQRVRSVTKVQEEERESSMKTLINKTKTMNMNFSNMSKMPPVVPSLGMNSNTLPGLGYIPMSGGHFVSPLESSTLPTNHTGGHLKLKDVLAMKKQVQQQQPAANSSNPPPPQVYYSQQNQNPVQPQEQLYYGGQQAQVQGPSAYYQQQEQPQPNNQPSSRPPPQEYYPANDNYSKNSPQPQLPPQVPQPLQSQTQQPGPPQIQQPYYSQQNQVPPLHQSPQAYYGVQQGQVQGPSQYYPPASYGSQEQPQPPIQPISTRPPPQQFNPSFLEIKNQPQQQTPLPPKEYNPNDSYLSMKNQPPPQHPQSSAQGYYMQQNQSPSAGSTQQQVYYGVQQGQAQGPPQYPPPVSYAIQEQPQPPAQPLKGSSPYYPAPSYPQQGQPQPVNQPPRPPPQEYNPNDSFLAKYVKQHLGSTSTSTNNTPTSYLGLASSQTPTTTSQFSNGHQQQSQQYPASASNYQQHQSVPGVQVGHSSGQMQSQYQYPNQNPINSIPNSNGGGSHNQNLNHQQQQQNYYNNPNQAQQGVNQSNYYSSPQPQSQGGQFYPPQQQTAVMPPKQFSNIDLLSDLDLNGGPPLTPALLPTAANQNQEHQS